MTQRLGRILIVDDEEDLCQMMFLLLKREGFDPIVALDGETALEMIGRGMPDAVLLDVKMPGLDGLEVLRRAKNLEPNLPVLIMTAYGGVHSAVEAIKQGAYDYLTKPVNNHMLSEKLRQAIANRSGAPKRAKPPGRSRDSDGLRLDEIMGPSDAIDKIMSEIGLVAPSDFTVIVQGETGTGKELVARAIHQASLRAKAPLVPVDCGAIPETLFESELFGHEKGSFTGAVNRRPGKFELAQCGTLLLDEISNMPLSCQIKLLRAIQERSFFRVGGRDPIDVDFRLIVASNQDLMSRVSQGLFSRDLFYRLSEFTIVIPPLRERKEDIIHLSNRFLQTANLELKKKVTGFSESAVQLLLESQWPGNVRQLRSSVRRAVLQASDRVQPEHLSVEPPHWETDTATFARSEVGSFDGLPLKEIVRRNTMELERRVLVRVLRKARGNKAEAARLLQVDYKTILVKIKQYGITIFPEDEDERKGAK